MLDAVDRLGVRDNTIVIFASDNGRHMNTHDLRSEMKRDGLIQAKADSRFP